MALAKSHINRSQRVIASLLALFTLLFVCQGVANAQPDDTKALAITSHKDGARVVRKILRLRGTIKAPEPIKMVLDLLYEDGKSERKRIRPYGSNFDVYCVLRPGVNSLIVKAIDGANGRHREEISVTYNPPASALRDKERKIIIEQPKKDAVLESAVLKVVGRAQGFPDRAVVYIQLQASSGTKSKKVTVRDGKFSAYFVIVDTDNTLDVRCGDQIETIFFECKAPKGYKPAPKPTESAPPATAVGQPAAPTAPATRRAAPIPIKIPDLKVTFPKQDQIVNSAVLKVKGIVTNAAIKLVKVHVVNDNAADTKSAEVVGGKFSKYFVMSTPFPVVRVEGFSLDGKKLAEDFIEFKCGKPKGWKGPLPWDYSSDVPDDPGATTGAPPVAAPVRRAPVSGGQTSAPASSETTEPKASASWEIILVPIVLFIMLPVIVVRGQFILKKLSKNVGSVAKTRPVKCEFCQAQGKRHFLFELPSEGEGKEILDGLVSCASLTENDKVNEELRPLLEKAHQLANLKPEGPTKQIACVWCRECKSGFIVLGDGEDEERYPMLAPVYFDWLLVSCGLH